MGRIAGHGQVDLADRSNEDEDICPSSSDTLMFDGSQANATLWTAVALAIIVLLNVAGSIHWIRQNIVLVGHDATAYLTTSLAYTEFLTAITPQTLFEAFTFPHYRTPAIYIAAQPYFLLFGADMDGAQLLNVSLLAVVIVLTYLIGRSVGSRSVGIFAALLVGLLPMTAAMARLFYTEMFLTAAVALNLLALYRCEGFSRRRWALIWAMSMGVGLLVKWTMPIYVVLPVIWVLWRAGIFQGDVSPLRQIRIDGRSALIAIVAGLVISAVWFLPNREQALLFPLADLLYAGWAMLIVATVYFWLRPSSLANNLGLALFLSATIASLWYLPHSDFIARLLHEDQVRGQQTSSPLNAENYLRYFRYLYYDHFGPLAFWLIVPAALFPWLRALWRRRPLEPRAALLWLSMLSAFLALSLLAQRNPRNLTPLLPSMALLATLGIRAYARPIALVIGITWITVLALQWTAFTFDGAQSLRTRAEPLWVQTGYVVPPSSQSTDPGYWIGPTVLERIAAESGELVQLGMLVNSNEIHRGIFNYLIARDGKKIGIKSLTEAETDGWFALMSASWLLFKDGNNHNVEAPGQALLGRIGAGDKGFVAHYEEVERYALPNGETAYLYRRPWGPAWPLASPENVARSQLVAGAIDEMWGASATLIYASHDLAVWVGLHDPVSENFLILDETVELDIAQLEEIYGTILLVRNHELREIRDWMETSAYRAYDVGDEFVSLTVYGRTAETLTEFSPDATWTGIALLALRTIPTVAPGDVIPVEMEFAGTSERDLKMSIRLTDADGNVVASQDRPIVGRDQYGLFVPPSILPGQYKIVAIVYDPLDMANIPDQDGVVGSVLAEITVSAHVGSRP